MRRADGPYPLVVFSHGAYGVRFQSVFFTAYLASHGYVVVAPDHPDNCLFDLFVQGGYSMEEVVNSSFDRPFDITNSNAKTSRLRHGSMMWSSTNCHAWSCARPRRLA